MYRNILFLALCLGAIFVVSSFKHTHWVDEGCYFAASYELSQGRIPALDYFTWAPYAAIAPFAGFMKILGPTLEAARLFSICAMTLMTFLTYIVVKKDAGPIIAVAAACLLVSNFMFLSYNTFVRPYAPFNLCVLLSLVILCHSRSPTGTAVFLSGLFFGIAANARVGYAPLLLIYVWIIWGQFGSSKISEFHFIWRKFNVEQRRLYCGLFIFGSAVATMPSLYIFLIDPYAFWTNLMGAYVKSAAFQDLGQQNMHWYIEQLLKSIKDAMDFLVYKTETVNFKFTVHQNLLVSVVPMGCLLIVSWRWISRRQSQTSKDIKTLRLNPYEYVGFGFIFINLFIATKMHDVYYHHVIPFFIIGTCLRIPMLWQRLKGAELNWSSSQRGHLVKVIRPSFMVSIAIVSILVNASIPTVFHMVWPLLHRQLPSFTSVYTNNQLACWLEQNTAPDHIVMASYPVSVIAAGRKLLRGYEVAGSILRLQGPLFGYTDSELHRLKVATKKDLRNAILKGVPYAVLRRSGMSGVELMGFSDPEKLREALDINYEKVGVLGQIATVDIYVKRDLPGKRNYTKLPINRVVRSGRLNRIAEELNSLFVDLETSFFRGIGADFEARCASLLSR